MLPVLNESIKYSTKIPSNSADIQFRPFLIKEEKVLLIAMESQDVYDLFTNEGTEFTIPAFIQTNFELEMTDGRVWDVSNAGATLSGPYFESPFAYKTIAIFN